MIKERYKKYAAIIQRAKEEGLHVNDKLSVLMDIESADRKFNIRLDAVSYTHLTLPTN